MIFLQLAPSLHQRLKSLLIFTFPTALFTFLNLTNLGYLFIKLTSSPEFITPVATSPQILSTATQSPELQPKIILGFLPFWNLKYHDNLNYQLLTDLAFFGLDFNPDGSIKKIEPDDDSEEPGWTAYKSESLSAVIRQAKANNTRPHLVIRAMEAATIESIVNQPQSRQRAIDQIIAVLKNRNFAGLNIDFEYAPTPHYQTTQNYTQFVAELHQQTKTALPNLIVSIDVYADAADKVRIWEIDKLISHVDYFVIMAYDFYRSSSAFTGPVAPLRGAPDRWPYDITQSLTGYLKIVPKEKIILGVPYYGYEWQTTSITANSPTYPQSGSLATYKRIQELLANQPTTTHWDQDALSPWLSYQDGQAIKQIYYEDERSLGLKYNLVNQTGLAGISIWALGYEGSSDNLWQLLSTHFR